MIPRFSHYNNTAHHFPIQMMMVIGDLQWPPSFEDKSVVVPEFPLHPNIICPRPRNSPEEGIQSWPYHGPQSMVNCYSASRSYRILSRQIIALTCDVRPAFGVLPSYLMLTLIETQDKYLSPLCTSQILLCSKYYAST